jgi:hypothetical protein
LSRGDVASGIEEIAAASFEDRDKAHQRKCIAKEHLREPISIDKYETRGHI